MSFMKREFERLHGLPHIEDIEAALDRGELPDADFDLADLPAIEDVPEPFGMCADDSDASGTKEAA